MKERKDVPGIKLPKDWDFIQTNNLILFHWAKVFYHDHDTEEAKVRARLLAQTKEAMLLFNLERLINEHQQKQVRLDLGEKQPWQNEKHSLYLTIGKDLVFGVEGFIGKATSTETSLDNHNAVTFLMALKNFGFRVEEDQLTSHSLNWLYLLDGSDQFEWTYKALSEVRNQPSKLRRYEKEHPLGPALRYLKDNMTQEAAYLTTLCFQASPAFLEGGLQEKFSFQCLSRVYQLEKLVSEGKSFWNSWETTLVAHIGSIFFGLIRYAPKKKDLPRDPLEWFGILEPHKNDFWNFLFFLETKNGEKERALELIRWEVQFLEKQGYIKDGKIQKRPKLAAHSFSGLKDGLKNLTKAVFT